MEKQYKKVRKTSWKSASRESYSNQGSTLFFKNTTSTKSFIFKASKKGSVGACPKVASFSNSNSQKCFKCQGHEHIAFNCPNHKIIVIIKDKITSKNDLPNESDQ